MEILAELLFLLLQVLLEIFGEVLLELGFSGLKELFGRENRDPVLATIGYWILGAVMGGLSLLMWPQRLVRPGPIPGLSLVVGPVAVGFAMDAWGRYRRSSGHQTTNLATLYGGGAFAFGLALVRLVWAE